MLTRIIVVSGMALSLVATAGFAGESHKQQKSAKKAPIICPVMGGKVSSPDKAAKSVYKGKTYYFCCPGCKPLFDKDPEKYLGKKKDPIICPVMKGQIASPEKAAGKSVYKGKTYYFCCAGCKPLFDKDPEKYLGKKK